MCHFCIHHPFYYTVTLVILSLPRKAAGSSSLLSAHALETKISTIFLIESFRVQNRQSFQRILNSDHQLQEETLWLITAHYVITISWITRTPRTIFAAPRCT